MSTTDVAPGALPLPPKPVDLDRAEAGIREFLIALGQEEKEEVMRNTPRRVAEMWAEFINPPNVDIEPDFKTFSNPGMNDLVIVNDVHYVSVCEHHLAPAFGVAHFAYVPDEKVVGYSKAKKALNYLSRQPQLNERLLVDSLDFLEGRLQPKGIALILRSVHCCIALRQNGPMQEVVTVSEFRGECADDTRKAEIWRSASMTKPMFMGA